MRVKKRALLDDRVAAEFGSRRRRMRARVFIGSAFLIAIPLVATTFASNVTIEGAQGGAIEFGQGTQKTIVCDAYIQTLVGQTWSATLGDFYVDKIILKNVDVNVDHLTAPDSNRGCGGKNLAVALYDMSDTATVIGNGSARSVSFKVQKPGDTFTVDVPSGDLTGFSATLSNASSVVTEVTKNVDTVTYKYSYTAGTDPIVVDDWVTITGNSGCNYSGAHVSQADLEAHTFTIDRDGASHPINMGDCRQPVGLFTANVFGKAVIELDLPNRAGSNLPASTVGRVSIASE
jgi:hypothetical protein